MVEVREEGIEAGGRQKGTRDKEDDREAGRRHGEVY